MNADIMFADRRRTVVESGSGALEVIVPDADARCDGQATGIRIHWPSGIIIRRSSSISSVRVLG